MDLEQFISEMKNLKVDQEDLVSKLNNPDIKHMYRERSIMVSYVVDLAKALQTEFKRISEEK